MPNSLLTPTDIALEALRLLKNNLVMGANVHREYKREFVKKGSTVNIRKPVRFAVTKGTVLNKSDIVEYNTDIKVDTQAHVGWEFSSQELTLNIDQYSERYIKPAMAELANTVDNDLTSLYRDVSNQVGTPGTTPSTFSALADAMLRLDELAAPGIDRKIVLNPAAHWAMADALSGKYNSGMVEDMVRKGYLGRVANAEIFMDQNIRKHTVGSHGGVPLVNQPVAVVEGATTVDTDGWTANTLVLRAGDVFTIAGVNEVNPVSGDSTGNLKQFVSLNDVTSGAAGAATIQVMPAGDSGPGLRSTGAYMNLSAMPADNAAITVIGTADAQYTANMAFQRGAFGLVVVPLQLPAGAWGQRVSDSDTGLSIRVVKDYDINNDKEVIRLDILYGVKTLHSDLACRIAG